MSDHDIEVLRAFSERSKSVDGASLPPQCFNIQEVVVDARCQGEDRRTDTSGEKPIRQLERVDLRSPSIAICYDVEGAHERGRRGVI